ncbi:MAG: hypothetical protein ACKOSQ_06755 [Planctomycetaceae bacterium]
MSTVTTGSRPRPAGGDTGARGSTVGFWLIVLAVLVIVGLLSAWLGGWFRTATDPRVAEIRRLQDEARAAYAANGGPATLAEATAAVAAMAVIREKVDALPENLRKQVERSGGGMMRDMVRGQIDAYFAAPPDQRRAELDRQIEREEIMRKAFEAGSAVANAVGAGSRQGGGGAAAGGPPRGDSQEDRNRWRKNIIDRTTPDDRARYTEYRRAMEQRREERGLPSGGPR